MEKILRLNYSTHAIEDILDQSKNMPDFPYTAEQIRGITKLLELSVKFLLPNCAELIDPETIEQEHYDLLRMPYSMCAFEIPWVKPDNTPLTKLDQIISQRRIALAIEKDTPELQKYLPNVSRHLSRLGVEGVLVIPITHANNNWNVGLTGAFMPYGESLKYIDKTELSRLTSSILLDQGLVKEGAPRFPCEPVPILEETLNLAAKKYGREKVELDSFLDTRDECMALIQACSVINCENIETDDLPVPAALSRMRAKKKNKAPLFNYKILSIGSELYKQPTKQNSRKQGKKVRMHLRRGHIRRLQSSLQIWVRPTIVNTNQKESIHKDYSIKSI